MNSTGAGMGCRPPFTAAQWQELEHQALIFKHMLMGIPIPPELLLPIRRSFDAMVARLYNQNSALGYCSFYGKKLDPEPGRCRRTDGKKWRCSKDAYPDSKYCERHMHRGRNRSRKPVESHPLSQSQSQSPSSTVTSLAPAGSSGNNGSGSSSGSFQSIPIPSIGSNPQGSYSGGAGSSQLHLDHGSYGMGTKDYRYLQGLKAEADEHSFFPEASGSARGLGIDSSLDSAWRLMPSNLSSYALSASRNVPNMQSTYPQLQSLHDLGQGTIGSSLSKQQQHSFFGGEFGNSPEPVRHETHSLRPFLDEWPRSRDSWSDLDEARASRSSTQLSISLPMASSDFSTTSSMSPNDD